MPAFAAEVWAAGDQFASLPACPLMHATGLGIGALPTVTFGGRVVLSNNAASIRRAVGGRRARAGERHRSGGRCLRPPDAGHPRRRARPVDLSSMRLILSSGAMFSAETKDGLLARMPKLMIIDYIAATEGAMGASLSPAARRGTGMFRPASGVVVLDEHDRVVEPGSGRTGMVAIGGTTHVGYFKDEAKTARRSGRSTGCATRSPGTGPG